MFLNWFIGLLVYLHDQTGYTTNVSLSIYDHPQLKVKWPISENLGQLSSTIDNVKHCLHFCYLSPGTKSSHCYSLHPVLLSPLSKSGFSEHFSDIITSQPPAEQRPRQSVLLEYANSGKTLSSRHYQLAGI